MLGASQLHVQMAGERSGAQRVSQSIGAGFARARGRWTQAIPSSNCQVERITRYPGLEVWVLDHAIAVRAVRAPMAVDETNEADIDHEPIEVGCTLLLILPSYDIMARWNRSAATVVDDADWVHCIWLWRRHFAAVLDRIYIYKVIRILHARGRCG